MVFVPKTKDFAIDGYSNDSIPAPQRFVKLIDIDHELNKQWEEGTVKDVIGVKGAYPRWVSLATASNQDKDFDTIVIVGDSKKENELKLAPGFPEVNLSGKEAIISHKTAQLLGLKEGDSFKLDVNLGETLKLLKIDFKES